MSNFSRRLALLLAGLGAAALLHAQQGRGVIYGTVTDPTGAAVPGVTVRVVAVDTNIATNAQTGAQGDYQTPEIAVGDYRLVVDHAGFKSVQRSGITLQVGQRAEINIQLTVGSVDEKVNVTADAPLVNTSDATVGNVVENKRISELPLNGRNALALMFLSPNVKSQNGATNSGFADRGISLSSVSINGGPSSVNNFMLDGGNNNQAFLQDLNVNPSVDAIQEFKVQSGVMSAEYGFTLGGVVNIASKSGGNDVHGTAYEFVRNNSFDARYTFSPTKSPYHYNQYGGAIGGPIYVPKFYDGRNKTFFFFNIEQYQYVLGSSPLATVPTDQERAGDFSNYRDKLGVQIPIYDPSTTKSASTGYTRTPFAGNVVPTTLFDKAAVNYIKLMPLPNRTPSNAFTHADNYVGASRKHMNMEQYLTKVNHYISDKDSVFVRFMYYNQFNDNGGNIFTNPILAYRYDNLEASNTMISEAHIFSSSVFNDFRLDIARNYFPFTNASYNQGVAQQLGLPASVPGTEIPSINAGLPGGADQSIGIRGQTTWQVVDTLTWIRGAHSYKIGFEGRLQQSNNFQLGGLSGSYNFAGSLTGNPAAQAGTGSALATFLLGQVSSASINTGVGQAEHGHSLSGFVQDDWRVNRRLTLNIGLRYDYQTWPVERWNGVSNFIPTATNPLNKLTGMMGFAGKDFGRAPFTNTPLALAPRVGFAWDMNGTSKTVVRGGFGLYYANIFYRDFFAGAAGFSSTTTSYNPPGNDGNYAAFKFSDGLPYAPTQPLGAALGASAFLGQGVGYTESEGHIPVSQQWSLSVQRQLPRNWVVEASYTGNHGVHLLSGGYDMNQMPDQYLSNGKALQNKVANPYAGIVPGSLGASQITLAQSLKPYPYYSSIGVSNLTAGNSNYHAGLLSLQKRFTKDLVMMVSYTKSKLLSDSVSVPINWIGIQTAVVGYQDGKYNRRAERSIDPTNVNQRLVLSGVYALPIGHGRILDLRNRVFNGVFGSWQAQGILTAQSGLPLVITGANNNLANRPNSTGKSAKLDNPTQYAWFDTSVFVNPPDYTYGNVGRTLPDVTGPRTVNVDLSLIKNIHLFERFSLQFRAEAFNAANHVQLALPNTSFSAGADGHNSSSSFGTITSAASARTLQFGAKLNF